METQINTYTVVKGQMKEQNLQINGLQSICPFTQPIPVPGNVGQIQIMRMPCTSTCPHAAYDGNSWTIKCSGDSQVFNITETPEEPKLQSKVIHLGD